MSASNGNKTCSMPDCTNAPRANQRYCAECHSRYMRAWRARRKREEREMKETIINLRKKVVQLNHAIEELKAADS